MSEKQAKITTYHYLSLYDSIKQNGDRHKANGDRYLAEDKLKHAAGSYRKAARNYERAIPLGGVEFTGHMLIDLMTQKIVDDVSDAIIYGTSYSKDGVAISLQDIFK